MKKQYYVIIGLIVLSALVNALFIVDQRQQAIILQFGDIVSVKKEPGLKFKLPFLQNVVYFDNRVLHMDADEKEVNAFEKETAILKGSDNEGRLIRLIVDAYAKYRIIDPLLFYQSVRNERGLDLRLDSVIEASLKQVLGGESLTTLLSESRTNIMSKVRDVVNREGKGFGIDVIDVRIKRVELPAKNRDAVYTRMRSSKEKEATRLKAEGEEESKRIRAEAEKEKTVLLATAEKEGQILRGKGDATATKIYADAYSKDSEFFNFYRTMQAYTNSMSEKNTRMVLSPDSEFLRYFNDIDGKRR